MIEDLKDDFQSSAQFYRAWTDRLWQRRMEASGDLNRVRLETWRSKVASYPLEVPWERVAPKASCQRTIALITKEGQRNAQG